MDTEKEIASIKKRIDKLEKPYRGQYMTRTEVAEESGRSVYAVQNAQNPKRNSERIKVKRLPEKNGKVKREDFEIWRAKNHSRINKAINARQMDSVEFDDKRLVATMGKRMVTIEISQQQIDDLINKEIDTHGYPSDAYTEVVENYPLEDTLALVWAELEKDHKKYNYRLRNP